MEIKMIKDMFIAGKEKETMICKNDIYKELLHSDLNLIFKDEILNMYDAEILKVIYAYNLRMERIRQKVMQDIDMILSSSNITPVFLRALYLHHFYMEKRICAADKSSVSPFPCRSMPM